ncbi:MAG TPA: 4Fe-4S binding protein [Methanocella sp.]|nr:4Fe-4S binding protein [Methanocella sp.]
MVLTIKYISSVVPGCCDISSADISEFLSVEQDGLRGILPEVNTIFVIGHHIQSSLEWAWFPFETERNKTTCAADLHAKAIVEKISYLLMKNGYKSAIIPYPGRCGIQFKNIAQTTGIGQMGDSFLILHPVWGPWIHLRVILTDAKIKGQNRTLNREICIHCGKCVSSCPGKVIGDGTFDGLLCDQTQLKMAEETDHSVYNYKCEICVRACPIGIKPPEINIKQGIRPKPMAK